MQRGIFATATPNGVYGVKIHWGQLEEFAGHVAAGDPVETLERCFPGARYVFLTRADKLRQAVSLRRAVRSDIWWKVQGESGGSATHAAPPTAEDLGEVGRLQRVLADHEDRWAELFATGRFGEPIHVAYDDLASDYAATITHTLERLGVPVPDPIPPARLERQADAVTDEWIAAFERARAAREHAPEMTP